MLVQARILDFCHWKSGGGQASHDTCIDKFERKGGDDQVAELLELLSIVNQRIGLYEEGIGQAKEAIGIFERLGDMKKLADYLTAIAELFLGDKQLDAAEAAASRALRLSSGKGLDLAE